MNSDGLRYYSKIDEARLQIMIKDVNEQLQSSVKTSYVNEQLQSSVKTSYGFSLEIYPMRLSMARIGWEGTLLSLSLHLSHHASCQVMRDTENFLSAYVIFPKSANPTCVFLGNVCKLGSVLQREVSDPARRIRNHRNCSVGG